MNSSRACHSFGRYFGARFGGTGRPTFCCFASWEDAATRSFLEHVHEITDLNLYVEEGEHIDIPPLGEAALCVKRMWLSCHGAITGLEQFQEIESIYVRYSLPTNGIDFEAFPRLYESAAKKPDRIFVDERFTHKPALHYVNDRRIRR